MKIKIFSIVLLFIFVNWVKAQQTSTSPYSSIGLGESKTNTDIVVSSMGGIATSYISDFTNEANFMNPAANRNLRFTSFNMGVNTDYTNEKTSEASNGRSTTYLSNISIAFPTGKNSRVGMNLQPYTNVGYDMNLSLTDPVNQKTVLKGRGGLNTFSGMYSYNLTEELSVGGKIGYVWGEIKKDQENSIEGASLISRQHNNTKYGFFDYTLGLAYQKRINKSYLLKIGATYNIGHSVNANVNDLYSTYYYNSLGEKQSIDTIKYVAGDYNVRIPSSYSLGVAYGKEQKWSLALDVKYTDQSKLQVPEYNTAIYKDKYRVALGGWYLPNINGFRSYFERVIYRYGIYYENMGVELNNKTLNQYALTAGVGLPLGKTGRQDPSVLNLGVEVGQRGTESEGLIKETFINFKIGFNFDDLWFRKRQYD